MGEEGSAVAAESSSICLLVLLSSDLAIIASTSTVDQLSVCKKPLVTCKHEFTNAHTYSTERLKETECSRDPGLILYITDG